MRRARHGPASAAFPGHAGKQLHQAQAQRGGVLDCPPGLAMALLPWCAVPP